MTRSPTVFGAGTGPKPGNRARGGPCPGRRATGETGKVAGSGKQRCPPSERLRGGSFRAPRMRATTGGFAYSPHLVLRAAGFCAGLPEGRAGPRERRAGPRGRRAGPLARPGRRGPAAWWPRRRNADGQGAPGRAALRPGAARAVRGRGPRPGRGAGGLHGGPHRVAGLRRAGSSLRGVRLHHRLPQGRATRPTAPPPSSAPCPRGSRRSSPSGSPSASRPRRPAPCWA